MLLYTVTVEWFCFTTALQLPKVLQQHSRTTAISLTFLAAVALDRYIQIRKHFVTFNTNGKEKKVSFFLTILMLYCCIHIIEFFDIDEYDKCILVRKTTKFKKCLIILLYS